MTDFRSEGMPDDDLPRFTLWLVQRFAGTRFGEYIATNDPRRDDYLTDDQIELVQAKVNEARPAGSTFVIFRKQGLITPMNKPILPPDLHLR